MSNIAFMSLLNRQNSKLSPHFGKAKWVAIHESKTNEWRFVQNTFLNGRAVLDILVAHDCKDVVFAEIGAGALHHLKDSGIFGWLGPSDVPIAELFEMLGRGHLRRATKPGPGRGHASSAKPGIPSRPPVHASQKA